MPWVGNSSLNSDYFDPDAIAMKVVGGTRKTPLTPVTSGRQSLVPAMPSAPSLTPRPTYATPAKQEFDYNVPISERPQGTEDWIWSRSRWAKENFDQEQAAKADAAYKQYAVDISAWQDEADRKQKEYEQQATAVKNYFGEQGLIAPLAGDPTPIVKQAQTEWQKAYAAGNQQAMNYWHGVAEQARVGAGWGSGGVDGNAAAGYLTNAGTPTWERQYKDTAYNDAMRQQELDNAIALTKATKTSGGGGGSGSGGGMTISQQLALMKYQDGLETQKESAIQNYVKTITALLNPKIDSTGGQNDNLYYRAGANDTSHAYPREALQKYKAIIGNDEIYNEVYRRIMGQYGKAAANPESYFK